MAANFQPFEVIDFSGGRTDNYVGGPVNRFKRADNLLVVKYGDLGKLLMRDGSELYDEDFPLVNPGIERLGVIRNFRTTSTTDRVLIQSNRDLFYLAGGGWTALQGPTTNKLFPTGTTVDNVTTYAEWNDHIFFTNDAFAPVSKVYNDGSAVLKLRTAGLPRLASNPTVTAGAVGVQNYIYRFVHKYSYAVGTLTYVDRGGYVEVEVLNSAAPNATAIGVSLIPTLANGVTYNWDTAAIKIEIYRTVSNGSTFYYVGEVTNGTAIYSDTTSDTTLQTNELLYTEGGVVENDPAPLAKLVHITGDVAYYAHTKDGSEIHASRLMQAIPGDPDSVPADFFVDVQDEIVGLSSTRGLPILLCKNSVYRIDGQFDLLGRGGMVAQKISDTANCVSAQSVVQTIEGVFWAGEDTYYFTDGYKVIKLCEDWAESYKAVVTTAAQKRRIQGKYDSRNRRVWWTIQEGSGGSDDVNACDILHLDWGIKPDACFTTASGGDQFSPTAIEFVNGEMLRGDRNGYLLIHRSTLKVDPKIDVAVTPANWVDKTIIFDYQSCAFNFGSSFLRKYVPRLTITAKNKSNLSLQVVSVNDDGRRSDELKPIRFRGNIEWGDPTIVWGTASLIWNFDGLIEEQRRFPAAALRCSYKQIQMTNALVAVLSSDILGTVTVDSAAKTATLTNAVTLDWPEDSVDYYIAFETDGYEDEFLITQRAADALTFADVANLSVSGSAVEWVIRGYPKREVFNLLSYTIDFTFMGKTQSFFKANSTGEVGV